MKHSVHELKLRNGAEGLLIDVPDASVMSFEFSFRAGDFRSPANKWDTAHIMEHMVLGANKKYPKARLFQAELQKNGAFMNASTSPYDLNYIVECADFEWERVLGLIKLSIESPKLSEEEFKAEIGNVREELVGDLNHNFRQVIIKARQKFGLTALSDETRIAQLDNIQRSDIVDFYKKTHRSGNLRFILSGNLISRKQQIEDLLNSIELESGDRVDMPDEIPNRYDDVYYIEKAELQNIYFFLNSFVLDTLSQSEDDALGLLNVMLCETLHSRILGEARERGLAYNISSNFNRIKSSTGWWFGAELTPKNLLPVAEIIVRELKRLQNGVLDPDDLEAAKQYSLGRYQRSAQTVSGIMRGYSGGYFFDGRIDDYFGFEKRIKELKNDDLIAVADKMLSDKIWGLTVMGSKQEELADQLRSSFAELF